MHFGIFVEEIGTGEPGLAFRDAFDAGSAREAWGLDCVWLGEIHFAPMRSVISASLQVASAIATRTRRLRVGTAVTVLPLNHPLRIARGRDARSHQRGPLEFGSAAAASPARTTSTASPTARVRRGFARRSRSIQQAWKASRSARRRVLSVQGATVAPRVSGPTRRSECRQHRRDVPGGRQRWTVRLRRLARRRGLRPTIHLALYRRAWREAGHLGDPSVYLRVPVYVSTTEQGAVEEPRESLMHSSVGRPSWRGRCRPPGAGPTTAARAGRAHGEPVLRGRPREEGGVRTPAGVIDSSDPAPGRAGAGRIVAELNPGGAFHWNSRREACSFSPTR